MKKVKIEKVIREKMIVSGREYVKAQEAQNSDLKTRVRLAKEI